MTQQSFNFTIRSGGQTGVDRATLDAARDFNKTNTHKKIINITGWCPKGRRAEDGQIPLEHPLKETETVEYSERTELNIRDSDATLILLLTKDEIDKGTKYTIEKAKEFEKPYKIIYFNENHQENINQVLNWLNEPRQINHEFRKINHLNVGGPRESNAKGIYDKAACKFQMREKILKMYGKCAKCENYNTHVGWCRPCDPQSSVCTGNQAIDDFFKTNERSPPLKVALKNLSNSQDISNDFLQELNKWCDSFHFDYDDAENKTALEIRKKFEAADEIIPALPEISQAHSGAIYTSRLLSFRNLSKPLNSIINQSTSDSKQINLFIPEDKSFGVAVLWIDNGPVTMLSTVYNITRSESRVNCWRQ
ncbi:1980_t:CDS:2, partial [Racocetra persica]